MEGKRLIPYTDAPEFSATDYLGNKVTLSDYKGQKLLLSFFRGASCPFCNMRLHELIKNYEKLKIRGLNIIAVFASDPKEIKRYAGKQEPPFPVIGDPHEVLYTKYGIESSRKGMLKVMVKPFKMMKMMFSGFFNMKSIKEKPLIPADFLINEHQIIVATWYGKDFGDHIPLEHMID